MRGVTPPTGPVMIVTVPSLTFSRFGNCHALAAGAEVPGNARCVGTMFVWGAALCGARPSTIKTINHAIRCMTTLLPAIVDMQGAHLVDRGSFVFRSQKTRTPPLTKLILPTIVFARRQIWRFYNL